MSLFQHLRNAFVLVLMARRSPGPPQRVPPRVRRSPAWMIQRVYDDHPFDGGAVEIKAPATWDGPSDPTYLLSEIEELRLAAQRGGYGTLAYLLHCAAEEAKTLAKRNAQLAARGKR